MFVFNAMSIAGLLGFIVGYYICFCLSVNKKKIYVPSGNETSDESEDKSSDCLSDESEDDVGDKSSDTSSSEADNEAGDKSSDESSDTSGDKSSDEAGDVKAMKKLRKAVKKEVIIFKNLEGALKLRDGLDVRCFAMICNTIDENYLMHRMTRFFDSIFTEKIDYVYIILHITSGGNTDDCTKCLNIMKKYLQDEDHNIRIYVPEIACSSGSHIAISGSHIAMGRFAHLTPFDDQLDGIGVVNIKRIMKEPQSKKRGLTISECDTILLADNHHEITKNELRETFDLNGYNNGVYRKAVDLFIDHKKYHTYPITAEMLKTIGMEVDELDDNLILDAFYELHNLWLLGDNKI